MRVFEHGTTYRYTNGGCRCDQCREAAVAQARRYRAKVRVEGKRLVDTKEVRRHLNHLTRKGVGLETVADVVGCKPWDLRRIRNRQTKRVIREFAARILAVDEGAIADGGRKNGNATRKAIARLRKLGVSNSEIAEARGWKLGVRTGITYPKGQVTAKTEFRILRFLREVETAVTIGEQVRKVCSQCGLDHGQMARVSRLRRLDRSATFVDAHEVWPCIYPNNPAGERTYYRDMDILKGKARPMQASQAQL